MSLALRILLMIFSVGFVYFVLKRIHKDQLRIQDSIFCSCAYPGVFSADCDWHGAAAGHHQPGEFRLSGFHLLRFYKDFLHGCEDQQFGGQNQ